MLNIELFIELPPRPWTVRKGSRFYNANQDYIQHARYLIREQYREKPLDIPLVVHFIHYMPIPKATSKKKMKLYEAGVIIHDKKPDTTNLNKQAEDLLTGIVWIDDAKNVRVSGEKRYGLTPGTLIRVCEYHV